MTFANDRQRSLPAAQNLGNFLGNSRCSDWVAQEIWVRVSGNWRETGHL